MGLVHAEVGERVGEGKKKNQPQYHFKWILFILNQKTFLLTKQKITYHFTLMLTFEPF